MSLESFHTSGTSPSRCRVAILGFGTVGSAVARRLTTDAAHTFELTHIFDRRADLKRRRIAGDVIAWTTCVEDVLSSGVDIVVEALGAVEPASGWIRAALLAGKSVVTANKQALAAHLPALSTLAARQGRQLRFEAAVGGAMPIVRAVADGLSGDRITRIVAILNGTTNAVLSRMEARGCSLEDALGDARAAGYAEADPTLDLNGSDARAKLAILCALAFGLRVAPDAIPAVSAESITPQQFAEARRHGGTIRQLAHAEYDGARGVLTAWVAPMVVPRGSIFARATGPQNAALITGVHSGDIGIFGRGAGGDATAAAILSDLIAIARDRAAIVPAPVLTSEFTIDCGDFSRTRSTFQVPNSTFPFAEAV